MATPKKQATPEESSEEEWQSPTKQPLTETKLERNDSKRSLPTRTSNPKSLIAKAIDANATITFMSLLTIYALYGDDVRILAFNHEADDAFRALSSMAFGFFLVEIALLCWCKEKYLRKPDFAAMRELCKHWENRNSSLDWVKEFSKAAQTGSFYFWLDLISTLSMAIEMPWFLGTGGGRSSAINTIDSSIAGKASIAGAKAANKLKIIRMVRLVRLAKLYKYLSTKQGTNTTTTATKATNSEFCNGGDSLDMMPPESHVGAEMSDRTTKKVIVGILIMLMGIPLLQVDELDYHKEFSMKMVFENRKMMPYGIDVKDAERWEFSESILLERTDCINITYSGFDDGRPNQAVIPEGRPKMEDLRAEEMDVITIADIDYVRTMTSVFDATVRVREEALLGILLTSFVIVLLGLGMVSFTKDVRNLVIVPIERMVLLVREISENPLGNDLSIKFDASLRQDDGMETTLLLRTISKIAGLMRVGFGEAGADIIGKNLNITQGTDTMNLLGNGRKIYSIFGFCDVRQFTDTTECLQEEVMLFVNRIAHILHSIVVQCDGAANKNIGDAFLLTWKVNTKELNGSCEDQKYVADKALYSFIKTMIEMNRHEDFLCNFSPRALSELYERMPGYKCRIGCGLHFGWAIEGAIGSSKKIDASYISPHVNMSESLEGMTKDYGVPILMSEPFYRLLSPEAMAGCRKVDAIKKRKGSRVLGLYTYDVDLRVGFSVGEDRRTRGMLPHHESTKFTLVATDSGSNIRNRRGKTKQTTSDKKTQKVDGLGDLPDIKITDKFPQIWNRDPDIKKVRAHFTKIQRSTWELGMQAFVDGKWDVANHHFSDVLEKSKNHDGPATNLLKRMKEYDFTAPKSWQGYWEI